VKAKLLSGATQSGFIVPARDMSCVSRRPFNYSKDARILGRRRVIDKVSLVLFLLVSVNHGVLISTVFYGTYAKAWLPGHNLCPNDYYR